jgi:type III secretion protein C
MAVARVLGEGSASAGDEGRYFDASDASIGVLLNALSGELHKPMIASDKVRRKRVTGKFDLSHSYALLARLSASMSLLWYDDGSSIYVYDNSEIRSAVVSMQRATVLELREFIRETRLCDPRFPIRGDNLSGTFYVTGAPIYVNLVTAAAKYVDQRRSTEEKGKQVVEVVRLNNSFVGDRRYALRDRQVDIPGMATVLARIFARSSPDRPASSSEAAPIDVPLPPFAIAPGQKSLAGASALPYAASDALGAAAAPVVNGAVGELAGVVPASDGVRAFAYPDTNSIILVGSLDKVRDMEALIRSLDVEKRQIELSLWIVDIKKSRLDQLGVRWRGSLDMPGLSVDFNAAGSLHNAATLDGAKFLASVAALSQSGDATVVSRPIVLTQENVPALFDSNQTFYVKLIGERTAALDQVTYGTLVSVLPRLSLDASEVEMAVNIEDGNTAAATDNGQIVADGNSMPLVNRTEISTVARVPREMSLLIGGNTRDDVQRKRYRVPGLASIPVVGSLFRGYTDQHQQVVRVFLIRPKLLRSSAAWQDGQPWESGDPAGNQALRAAVKLLQPYMGSPQ